MSRPTHTMQQRALDISEAPAKWFWQPDPAWLNQINTTNLRSLNAIRVFVGLSALFSLAFTGVLTYALTRCDFRNYGALASGETLHGARRLCEESMATARLLDFASGLFDSFVLLLAAMAGLAIADKIGKRMTDTEHVERVEKAKKAPIIVPPIVTSEHPAKAPVQSMTVNVGDEAVETAKNGAPPATVERPAVQSKPKTEPDAYADDERGD